MIQVMQIFQHEVCANKHPLIQQSHVSCDKKDPLFYAIRKLALITIFTKMFTIYAIEEMENILPQTLL